MLALETHVANGFCVIHADAQSKSWTLLLWGWGCRWTASALSSLRPLESGNHNNAAHTEQLDNETPPPPLPRGAPMGSPSC